MRCLARGWNLQAAAQRPSASRKARSAQSPGSRPVRARTEKILGTWKRSCRFRRMRWIGPAKAKCQVHLDVIVYNVKRHWRTRGP
ncbi:MAG: transposase [Methylocella sp.]